MRNFFKSYSREKKVFFYLNKIGSFCFGFYSCLRSGTNGFGRRWWRCFAWITQPNCFTKATFDNRTLPFATGRHVNSWPLRIYRGNAYSPVTQKYAHIELNGPTGSKPDKTHRKKFPRKKIAAKKTAAKKSQEKFPKRSFTLEDVWHIHSQPKV